MSEIIILSSDGEENDEKISKKESSSTKLKPNNQKEGTSSTSDPEFKNHAPFERFLDYCADIEMNRRNGRARTMNVIKEKLLARYNAADPEYIKSEAFEEIVSLARIKAEKDPRNLFVYVKQVVDELKLRSRKKKNEACKRKNAKSEAEPESKRLKEETAVSEEEQNEVIKVNEKHVAKLERLFQKVYRKVKKLGEKEVDFDEDDDSAYIRWTRYEKRLYLIWEKWQEAKGQLDEVKRLKSNRIAFAGTQHQNLNKAIEHFANKTQKFPDFHDILNLTTETLEGKGKNPEEIREIASSAFTNLGDQLQKHRVYSFWNSLLTYLPSDMENVADPAEKDEELDKKLKENHEQNKHKMKEVLNNFVDQQIKLKLEPEEVPPGEEDDDCKSEDEGKEDEEEEEEEQEEDIIAISSSSEESEVEENAEENGIGDADHCENGDARDTKELKLEVNKKTNSVKENSKMSSSGWFTVVKSDKDDKNMESIASCSSHRKKKVTKDSDCVVTLSESD